MKRRIFTEEEKEALRHYLEKGERTEGFEELKTTVWESYPEIIETLHLMSALYLKDRMWESETPTTGELPDRTKDIAEFYATLDIDDFYTRLLNERKKISKGNAGVL